MQRDIPNPLVFIEKSDEQQLMDGKLGGLGSIAKGAYQKQETNISALPWKILCLQQHSIDALTSKHCSWQRYVDSTIVSANECQHRLI